MFNGRRLWLSHVSLPYVAVVTTLDMALRIQSGSPYTAYSVCRVKIAARVARVSSSSVVFRTSEASKTFQASYVTLPEVADSE